MKARRTPSAIADGTDKTERFNCIWRECSGPVGATNPAQLLEHVREKHLASMPSSCAWGSCKQSPFTLPHLLTHLPLEDPVQVPKSVAVSAATPGNVLWTPHVTNRKVPPLPLSQSCRYVGQVTPTDDHRNPMGVAFLSALILRGLARNLRAELAIAKPDDGELSAEQKKQKKKHLAEERFGLPIPQSVLQEEEEEEKKDMEADMELMSEEDLNRARRAFRDCEDKILEVASNNESGLALYLGESFGW